MAKLAMRQRQAGENEKNLLPSALDKKPVVTLSGANDKAKCVSQSVFIQELSKIFPKIKILNVNIRHNGLIFLTFASQQDAQQVIDGWKPEYFGSCTKVNFIQPAHVNILIMKNVSLHSTDAESLNELQKQFPSCDTFKRFISASGKSLPVAKVTFKDNQDANNALNDGVYLGNMYIKPEKYLPAKQPTRCFNCNKFGHVSNFCRNTPVCAKCSQPHKTDQCTEHTHKCCNCGQNHPAYTKSCPTYLENFKKVNFL